MLLQRIFHTFSKSKFNLRSNLLSICRPNKVPIGLTPGICSNAHILLRTSRLSYLNGNTILYRRTFHLSNQNRALPPLLWVIIRPLLRIAAIITGRGLRKWWASLPKSKRAYFLNKLKRNQQKVIIGSVLSCGAVYTYYILHLIEDPITKRKQFMIFSNTQINQMAMIEFDVLLENHKGQIIKSGHQYEKVMQISQRILRANRHLPGTKKNWQVFIVNDIETMNAFVLPSGQIFIFTGMLAIVNNQDQLAAVIAHEMAHALLNHSAEIASKTHLLEMLMLLPLVALWTLFPDTVALFSHYVMEYVSEIIFHLPFSRSLELEADVIGVEMISRACYDPRQVSLLWKMMDKVAEDKDVELLSTHPSHQTRYELLDELMPKALKIVADHCPNQDINPHLSRPRTAYG